MEECQVVGPLPLPANEQGAKPVVPCIGTLHDPPPSSTTAAAPWLLAASSDVRLDSTCSNLTVDVVEVVALVETQIRRPTRPPRRSHDNGIDRGDGSTLVVDVRGGDLGRERHTSAVGEDVTLDARLASVRRVGAGRVAALGSLHDRAVQRRPLPVDSAHVVVELDELLKESS